MCRIGVWECTRLAGIEPADRSSTRSGWIGLDAHLETKETLKTPVHKRSPEAAFALPVDEVGESFVGLLPPAVTAADRHEDVPDDEIRSDGDRLDVEWQDGQACPVAVIWKRTVILIVGEVGLEPSGDLEFDSGTPIEDIRSIPNSSLCIEFTSSERKDSSPLEYIEQTWRIPSIRLPLPVGIRLTDHFFAVLERFFNKPMTEELQQERQRLVDLYVDGHKLAFGKKFALYGDEDMVASMAGFLCEAGFTPALIAANSSGGNIHDSLYSVCEAKHLENAVILENPDFGEIEDEVQRLNADEAVDFMIGNSKGFKIATNTGLPLVRVGFPIHDRIGASHIVTLGYKGAANLYTTIINMLLEKEQAGNMYHYGTY